MSGKRVRTYRLAYLDRQIDLCDDCAVDAGEPGPTRSRVGVLGPVSYGQHWGLCSQCEHIDREAAATAEIPELVEIVKRCVADYGVLTGEGLRAWLRLCDEAGTDRARVMTGLRT